MLRHLAPAGVIILRTATDGNRSRRLDGLGGSCRREARGAFLSRRPAEVRVFNNTPSFNLPCDSVKHQGIMHLALTILCKFYLLYMLPWAASSSEVWQLSLA